MVMFVLFQRMMEFWSSKLLWDALQKLMLRSYRLQATMLRHYSFNLYLVCLGVVRYNFFIAPSNFMFLRAVGLFLS
jgi:hypothetical protein